MSSWSFIAGKQIKTEVELRGYNRVNNQLRALASAHTDVTDPVIEKHTKALSAMFRGKPYPNKLPNQKYQRTYNLRRGFRAQNRGKGKWAVINRAKRRGRYYALWVIKKGFQNRKYHLGRWWTIEDESQKTMPTLTRNLSLALEQLMERQTD